MHMFYLWYYYLNVNRETILKWYHLHAFTENKFKSKRIYENDWDLEGKSDLWKISLYVKMLWKYDYV
jgi:hypothetical protein